MSIEPRQAKPAAARATARLWYVGFAGFLALTLLGGALAPSVSPTAATQPAATVRELASAPAPVAPPAATMDDAVRLIEAAAERFRDVKDYTCRLAQRERVGEKLPPETVCTLTVRSQPFSVHMKWLEPRTLVGQEAIYVAGKNDGKMRVRSAGLLGAVGFVSLAVDDQRARNASRHSITEAGLGHLIAQFGAGWPEERRDGLTVVQIDDCVFAGRPCQRVDTLHPCNPGGDRFRFSRSLVYFDKKLHLPLRIENYAWPTSGSTTGALLEEYSYLDLKLNVGVGEDLFNR